MATGFSNFAFCQGPLFGSWHCVPELNTKWGFQAGPKRGVVPKEEEGRRKGRREAGIVEPSIKVALWIFFW